MSSRPPTSSMLSPYAIKVHIQMIFYKHLRANLLCCSCSSLFYWLKFPNTFFCHLVLNRIKVLGFNLFSQFEFYFIQENTIIFWLKYKIEKFNLLKRSFLYTTFIKKNTYFFTFMKAFYQNFNSAFTMTNKIIKYIVLIQPIILLSLDKIHLLLWYIHLKIIALALFYLILK